MQPTKPATTSLENHWMPFTANYDFIQAPRLVVKGEGMYLWNESGKQLLDCSSGLFCVALGHCREEITEAVSRQLSTLDFISPFQLGQPKSFELASKLADLLPGDIGHVFFSNSGSESIDTAMKLIIAYHQANGEARRTKFISRERSYHGMNIGGTSLAGIVRNRRTFEAITLNVCHMRHTLTGEERFVNGQPQNGAELADDLLRAVDTYGGENIAACFVEPIAGSTGMLIPPMGYLERLRDICNQHGILLVFDEVITGFGRTGKMFASEAFGVTPDIITMAKALTNGALPMGATAVSKTIYNRLVKEPKGKGVEFAHGYTYSGHPVACAAALATLDIFQKENIVEHAAELSPYFLERVFSLRDLPGVVDIRGYGMAAAVDFETQGAPGAYGMAAAEKLYNAGLHVRFSGDCAMLTPSLICETAHVDQIVETIRSVLG
jgi:beta-alanine--pyruvate transaminase